MKVDVDETKILGAVAVLENYLDGALADFEDDQVENVEFLEDCIYVHRLLDLVLTHGWKALSGDEYTERFNKKMQERKGGLQ